MSDFEERDIVRDADGWEVPVQPKPPDAKNLPVSGEVINRVRKSDKKYELDLVPRKFGDSKTSYQATAEWRERNRQKYNDYMSEYMKKRRLKEKGEQ